MVEEVESGDAETDGAVTAHAEAFLQRKVAVPELRSMGIREDVLSVGAGGGQRKACTVDVLVAGQMRTRIACQYGLEADIRGSQDHLVIYGKVVRAEGALQVVVGREAHTGLHVWACLDGGDSGDEPVIDEPSDDAVLHDPS